MANRHFLVRRPSFQKFATRVAKNFFYCAMDPKFVKPCHAQQHGQHHTFFAPSLIDGVSPRWMVLRWSIYLTPFS